jgi:nucleoside triphosphate diphosphatase
MQDKSALGRAIEVVRDLRNRCPWDRAQSRESLRPYLVEEVLELDHALDQNDPVLIREEMADFLLHLAWQFVIAEENGEFHPEQIAAELEVKMRRRHPHLYDLGPPDTWQRLKKREGRQSILDGLPPTLPSLLTAARLQERAASIGFDWPDTRGPALKVREELVEVEQELSRPGAVRHASEEPGAPDLPSDALTDEIGDLLFAVVNLARKAHVQPGVALDRANRKFRARFVEVERRAAERGLDLHTAGLEVLDAIWEETKQGEQGAGSGER